MHACKQIVEMNHFSRVVAACISLTFVGCLLAAVVHAVPASAHPVIDSELGDGNSDPIPGDEEQINVNEEDVNDGKLELIMVAACYLDSAQQILCF